MIILFHLFFLSFSHQCKYQIFPKLGQPSEETFNVDEGEHICINSSGNYFNVLFHNSLLSVRYFTSSKSISQSINNNAQPQINKNLVEAGKFLFPSEKGGVSFPKSVYGSIEVTTLIPGNVTISTLSFPDECTLGRYVSTESSLELHIANTFGTYPASEKNTQEQSSLCVWYPQNDYTLQASISPSQDDHIFVCSSYSSCEEPFSRTQQYIDISSNKFIKVIPKTKDFWTDLNLIFSTDNPSNLFQISGIMKDDENAVSYQLSMKKVDNEEDENEEDNKHVKAKANENIEDDNNNNNNDNDNDNDNINNVNNENDNQARAYIKNSTPDFHRHRKNRRSNSDSYSTLVVFLSAFVCLFLVSCLIVYIISQNGSCSKNRSHPNDHSEERLLPNSQGGFFPAYAMPWGQHPPGQGFFTGVFPFAGVPGQPQQPQQQMQYFTSPGSTFQNVPNFPQQDNQNDQNNKNENNQSQQQMQFQQPVVYVVPPQYQQQYMQQQQQYMQQYQQNLPQYPQNTPTQQQTNENQPQQQNDKNQSQEQNQENQP